MTRSRSTALALAAALLLAPCAVDLTAPASAALPQLSSSYCSRQLDGACAFPSFAATEVPDLQPGQTVTITGTGATTGVPGFEPVKIRAGFLSHKGSQEWTTLSEFEGSAQEDGAWSVTVTAPNQETIDRSGTIEIWLQASGPDGAGHHVLHELSGEVAFPKMPAPEPSTPAPSVPAPAPSAPGTAGPTPPPSNPAPLKKGWYREGGSWYWGDDKGVQAKGWKRIDGTWYFFDAATAAMRTGWVKDGGSWYYLASSGAMRTGWVKDGGSWYYLASSGAMKTGWVKDGASWYYLRPSGAMATGWVKDGGSWYFLRPSGAMATGWVKDGGSWYFLQPSGAMATGWLVIDGRWSLFSASGAWQRYW